MGRHAELVKKQVESREWTRREPYWAGGERSRAAVKRFLLLFLRIVVVVVVVFSSSSSIFFLGGVFGPASGHLGLGLAAQSMDRPRPRPPRATTQGSETKRKVGRHVIDGMSCRHIAVAARHHDLETIGCLTNPDEGKKKYQLVKPSKNPIKHDKTTRSLSTFSRVR